MDFDVAVNTPRTIASASYMSISVILFMKVDFPLNKTACNTATNKKDAIGVLD